MVGHTQNHSHQSTSKKVAFDDRDPDIFIFKNHDSLTSQDVWYSATELKTIRRENKVTAQCKALFLGKELPDDGGKRKYCLRGILSRQEEIERQAIRKYSIFAVLSEQERQTAQEPKEPVAEQIAAAYQKRTRANKTKALARGLLDALESETRISSSGCCAPPKREPLMHRGQSEPKSLGRELSFIIPREGISRTLSSSAVLSINEGREPLFVGSVAA